ncbi:MAG: hypothetical protein HN345_08660 [Planctomycetaceae bacterium]|nr:hypothetical protein [Planctomycetaceae bacterium]
MSPHSQRYAHWRFYNVQLVATLDSTAADGMLLFNGWGIEIYPVQKLPAARVS